MKNDKLAESSIGVVYQPRIFVPTLAKRTQPGDGIYETNLVGYIQYSE